MPDDSTAARLVTTARGNRGMSQRDLAAAAGVPQSTVSKVESGQRQPSVAMLERLLAAAGYQLKTQLVNTIRPSVLLEKHCDRVAEILCRYPVTKAWTFGSVARGDDRQDSDLDVLVELAPGASFADVIGLDEDLASALSCPVDVVTTAELESRDRSLRDTHAPRFRSTPRLEINIANRVL
ncbi:MAG TPA: helix-turn-helix domain-containing protein [Actinokineospora sp.]|nr:helix-turn-helix domain-containing protein [Actinokineospora sp.]